MWHISNEWICGIAVRVRLNLASNIRFMYTGSHSLKQNPTSISLFSIFQSPTRHRNLRQYHRSFPHSKP
ncbi:hypothetical protein Hanom_Chr07g00610901 [Helianthus anomalus]